MFQDNNYIYLPFQNRRPRVLSYKLTMGDIEHIDDIRKWVIRQCPSKFTSSHWWYNKLPADVKEHFRNISESCTIMSMFQNRFGNDIGIDCLHDMNEIYVSPPCEKKDTSDLVFFTRHIDGPYYYMPFASCYRLIIGMDNNKEIKTVFDMVPYDKTVGRGDVIAFDFHRECHHIEKIPDESNDDFRVVLKVHYCIYPKCMRIFGTILGRLSIHYNKQFRSLFLYTITPETVLQKITARNVVFFTKLYYTLEAYIGYNNILYLLFTSLLSYYASNYYIFVIATSYIHYMRYLLTDYSTPFRYSRYEYTRDVLLYMILSYSQLLVVHNRYMIMAHIYFYMCISYFIS